MVGESRAASAVTQSHSLAACPFSQQDTDHISANYTERQRIISDVLSRLRKLDTNERVDVLQLREE